MSYPSLTVFLEIELFQWVKFAGASSHDVTVSGNRVGHVEVIDILREWGSVCFGFTVWLMSKAFESTVFNEVVFDQMWGKFSDSGSELFDGVIREW